MSQSTAGYAEQIGGVVTRIGRFVFGSFFRFMILLGVLLHAMGYFWAGDIVAGHLLIYGSTAIAVGVIGRVITWWKIQDEY